MEFVMEGRCRFAKLACQYGPFSMSGPAVSELTGKCSVSVSRNQTVLPDEGEEDGSGGGMSYDRMRRLLDQRESELEQIRNQLEQIKTHYEVAASNFKHEVQQKDNEISDLKAELHELQDGADDAAVQAREISKLKAEVRMTPVDCSARSLMLQAFAVDVMDGACSAAEPFSVIERD
eukprot:scaffold31201_cov37-Prasinocladus_malaysianus.AAC.1